MSSLRPKGTFRNAELRYFSNDDHFPDAELTPIGTTGQAWLLTEGIEDPDGEYNDRGAFILKRISDTGETLASSEYFRGDGTSAQLLAAQSDGRLLYQTAAGLRRLNLNGTVDTSFGTTGVAGFGFDHFDVDSKGRVLAWRTIKTGSAAGDVQVQRYSAAGKLDATFGTSGLATVDTVVFNGTTNVLLDGSDRVLVTAYQVQNDHVTWSTIRLSE